MPLLWVLRDELGLTGTKYGCGIAACGACTVLVDGQAVRSCVMPVSALDGKTITTIEALSKDGTHPVQKAWMQPAGAPVRLLSERDDHSGCRPAAGEPQSRATREIDAAMTNICRCGTYVRVREAIHVAAKSM